MVGGAGRQGRRGALDRAHPAARRASTPKRWPMRWPPRSRWPAPVASRARQPRSPRGSAAPRTGRGRQQAQPARGRRDPATAAATHYDMVADGEAALDALQANEYDVVLMDVNMPVIDGIEATQPLSRHGARPAASADHRRDGGCHARSRGALPGGGDGSPRRQAGDGAGAAGSDRRSGPMAASGD